MTLAVFAGRRRPVPGCRPAAARGRSAADAESLASANTSIGSRHVAKAGRARSGCASSFGEVFQFVRKQSTAGTSTESVTCRASGILRHGTGYCYAKSHLQPPSSRQMPSRQDCASTAGCVGAQVSAILSAQLNAIYLQQHGWYRINPEATSQRRRGVATTGALAFPVHKEKPFLKSVWNPCRWLSRH